MIAEAEMSQAGAGEEQVDPGRWRALLVLLLAASMDLVDASIVNVGIPAIQRDLGATYAAIQWVLAGYTLAFALLLITGGRLGDIYGRKRMFLLGVAGFTAASALCGAAVTPEMLIGCRLLQGAMGAMMVPQVLSVVQVIFLARERGAAFGIYGAVVGLATVAGPILGGLLVEGNLFGLGWRPIFLVNLPLGVFAFIAASLVIKESKATRAIKLDVIGVGIITLGLLLLIYPLVQGRELGWPAWTYASIALSVPVIALFALYERRKTRLDGSPLVELSLFRLRAFVGGMLANLIFFAGIASFFLVLVLYLQIGLGFSPLQAGLTGLPFSVGAMIASGLSIRMAPKLGRRTIHLGSLIIAAGMAGLVFTIYSAGTGITSWLILPSMFVSGVGLGFVAAPIADIVLSGIPERDAGSASGVFSTVNQVGGALGVAVIGVIFFGLLSSQAGASVDATAPEIRSGLQSAGLPPQAVDGIIAGFRTCFNDRMAEKDPSSVPASCQRNSAQAGALPPQAAERINQVLASAANHARQQVFTDATRLTMMYEVGIFLLTFLSAFLLPRAVVKHPQEQRAAAAAAAA